MLSASSGELTNSQLLRPMKIAGGCLQIYTLKAVSLCNNFLNIISSVLVTIIGQVSNERERDHNV